MRARLSVIRKATPSDSSGILECLRAAFEVYRSRYTPGAFVDTVLTADALQHRLATMCVLVAVSESGEIVGTIGGHVVDAGLSQKKVSREKVDQEKEGHIRGVAVLPAWQGSGVAAQLLKSIESELRNQGCSVISLDTTEPLLPAMRFYEKNGFRKSGKVTNFFDMPLFEYVKLLTE